jgi:hypothetical protein
MLILVRVLFVCPCPHLPPHLVLLQKGKTRNNRTVRTVPFDPTRVWWQFIVLDETFHARTFLFDPTSTEDAQGCQVGGF